MTSSAGPTISKECSSFWGRVRSDDHRKDIGRSAQLFGPRWKVSGLAACAAAGCPGYRGFPSQAKCNYDDAAQNTVNSIHLSVVRSRYGSPYSGFEDVIEALFQNVTHFNRLQNSAASVRDAVTHSC